MSNADQFRQYAEEAMGWARLAETSKAIVLHRSRSQMIVPYRWFRRHAQSSIPTTVGGAKDGLPRLRTTRRRVSLLTGSISLRAKLAAGRPPRAGPR
jgi:hypothetical protein